jgi:hypothetical protein
MVAGSPDYRHGGRDAPRVLGVALQHRLLAAGPADQVSTLIPATRQLARYPPAGAKPAGGFLDHRRSAHRSSQSAAHGVPAPLPDAEYASRSALTSLTCNWFCGTTAIAFASAVRAGRIGNLALLVDLRFNMLKGTLQS